jgi:hypothetical protein
MEKINCCEIVLAGAVRTALLFSFVLHLLRPEVPLVKDKLLLLNSALTVTVALPETTENKKENLFHFSTLIKL